MFVRRIDGTVSRMVRAITGGAQFARQLPPGVRGEQKMSCPHLRADSGLTGRESSAGLGSHGPELMNADTISYAANFSNSWRWTRGGLLDAGLDLARRCAGFLGSLRERGDARARWIELPNKIAAYRLFQGRDRAGHSMRQETICRLDPYSRLFAAEGYAYRNARPGALLPELLPELSPIAIHAGAGLRLAEQALENIDAGRCESEVLAEFSAVCRRDAFEGFGGIVEEALGLVARTLYPHLMKRLDERLRIMNAEFWARFWHGAGRGIYFAPSNILPFRAVPWRGVAMCSREPPHETGKRNSLSGFCFALTLVNLRQPEVLEAFFKHHAAQAPNCIEGAQAAMAVWTLSGRGSEATEGLAAHCPSAHKARVLWPMLWPCGVAGEDGLRPERLFSARLNGQ